MSFAVGEKVMVKQRPFVVAAITKRGLALRRWRPPGTVMNLNDAKQQAYSAAHRAAAKIKTMMQAQPPVTIEDAVELTGMARQLVSASMEIEARLTGVPEPQRGEVPGGAPGTTGVAPVLPPKETT